MYTALVLLIFIVLFEFHPLINIGDEYSVTLSVPVRYFKLKNLQNFKSEEDNCAVFPIK